LVVSRIWLAQGLIDGVVNAKLFKIELVEASSLDLLEATSIVKVDEWTRMEGGGTNITVFGMGKNSASMRVRAK
jgi:hypothetical protein